MPIEQKFSLTQITDTGRLAQMTADASQASLLRHRDFVRLWAAETISQFGTQVTFLALPLAAILVLRANSFQVGLIDASQSLPFLLIGLPAGAWIDRLRRRPLMIASDVGRGLALLSVPIAYAAGVLSLPQLWVVAFVVGAFVVFFDVSYQSYLPSLIGEERLVDGSSKLEISRSSAAIAGPGIAGALVATIGAPFAILADALSYFGSAAFIASVRHTEAAPAREGPAGGTSLRREIADGLRFVVSEPRLRAIALFVAWVNLWIAVIFAVLLLYFVHDLGLGPLAIGAIFAVGNLGWLGGALLGDRIPRRFGVGPTLIGTAVIEAFPMFAIVLAPRDAAVPILMVAWAVFGFGVVVNNVNQVAYRQTITAAAMRGRMNASMQVINQGTIPVGAIAGGILGTMIGLHATFVLGAVGMALAFVPLALSPVRSASMGRSPAVSKPG